MPGQRYRDPMILIRKDVRWLFYYIQPYVPVLTPAGMVRKRQNVQRSGAAFPRSARTYARAGYSRRLLQ